MHSGPELGKNGKTIYSLNMYISYMFIVVFWVKELISVVYFCLGVVMTALVVITCVVIGGQSSIWSSIGMLHIKTWLIEVSNVKFGVILSLGVVMTTKVVKTRMVN